MTPFSLYPVFTRIFYRTPYAPHTMTLPNRGWNPPSSGHDSGTYLANDGSQVDVITSVGDYLALLAPVWTSTTSFDQAIVYTMADPVGQAIPVAILNSTVVGTNTNTTWDEATQITITLRTGLFNKFKLVMLDVPSNNDYNKYTNLGDLNAAYQALITYFGSDPSFICGRDRGKPEFFVSLITDLNDKLRQEYRLA